MKKRTWPVPSGPFIYVGRIYQKGKVCRRPECGHPKPHMAFGLCRNCYFQFRQAQPDKRAMHRAYRLAWEKRNPIVKADTARRSWLKKYGLTQGTFDLLFASQEGLCAICRTILQPSGRETHIDHDHQNHLVRGLLCRRCNRALGLLRDDEDVLKAAVVYLRRAKAKAA